MTENTQNTPPETPVYREVSKRLSDWLELHKDETFDLDLVCRQTELISNDARKLVATKLRNEVLKGTLEKNNKVYRYIDSTLKQIDWLNSNTNDSVEIKWPYGVEDDTHFGFDGHVVIPQKSLIIIAGVTNMGKSTFALNFLWMNMDQHHCILMGNEYEPSQFKRRANTLLDINNPVDLEGKPKFELVERYENWKDIIQPDAINIIDWINLGDKFYELGKILEGIKEKLNKGIALCCIQKDSQKSIGMGGMWGTHLSTLYLTLDYNRMTVEKCKEWNGHNPNREMYGFDIIEHGSRFNDIRRVDLCPKCRGFTGNNKCLSCLGKGFVNKES
jgi:hypothetical protein